MKSNVFLRYPLVPGLRLTAFALLCVTSVGGVFANDRVALVVGNAQYPSVPLTNTSNDAHAMAELLDKAGFKVDKQIDTNLAQLQAAVDRFGSAIRDPKVKFGVFYYAGHGLQQDWHNYLVPVSAKIRAASDVAVQTVDVSRLLRFMEQAKGRNFLVVLDACREDPFAGSFRPAAKGLSQFDAPVGSLLAFATSPGSFAADGNGKNGLYTGYLLREFAVPGARVEDAFKRVRLSVRMASKGAQIPWESTSLEEDISIFPSAMHKLTEAERDQLLEREMTAWLRIKSSEDPDELAAFIREYPSGSASELAQSRMNRMLAAMASQERQRMQNTAKNAAQRILELAAHEEAARKSGELAEQQRRAAEKAESERIRLAHAEEERQIALQQVSLRALAALAESARVAKENAQAAEQESARLAIVKEHAERQSRLNAQAAAELAQLQAQQQQLAEQQQAKDRQAEQARTEALRQAALQQREAARIAAETQNRQAQEELRVKMAQDEERRRVALLAEQESARLAQLAMAQQQAQRQQLALESSQRAQAAREAAATALAVEQEARRVAAAQQEQARLTEMRAQAATAQLQHLADLQIKKENQERELAAQAKKTGDDLAERVVQRQLEVTRFASERQALLAVSGSTAAAQTIVPTPFFQGSNEHMRRFSVGDQATVDVVDKLTRVSKRRVMEVTGTDLRGDRITYNDGEYVSDLMGNTTRNLLGSFSTPRQLYPAELMVGNKWKTRFKQSRPGGITYTFQYDLKVVGKEKVTVPAGTFDTYKIEARGFNMELNATVERNIWVAPGVNTDIVHEITVRLKNGRLDQYDREELVSFMQVSNP